jgi:hypothetical protein
MMTNLSKIILTLSLAAGAVLASSQDGRAQAVAPNQPSPYQTYIPAPEQLGTGSRPLFTIGGVGVHVWTPTAKPYNGTGTYEIFAGQPVVHGNGILAQSARGRDPG